MWERERKIVVMVTHDIDEALYLADRLILMTDGPAATVGEILSVPFPRPRERAAVLEHPEYYACHQRVIRLPRAPRAAVAGLLRRDSDSGFRASGFGILAADACDGFSRIGSGLG